jgi:hypothetical protein
MGSRTKGTPPVRGAAAWKFHPLHLIIDSEPPPPAINTLVQQFLQSSASQTPLASAIDLFAQLQSSSGVPGTRLLQINEALK